MPLDGLRRSPALREIPPKPKTTTNPNSPNGGTLPGISVGVAENHCIFVDEDRLGVGEGVGRVLGGGAEILRGYSGVARTALIR